jgi:hypothetical protein
MIDREWQDGDDTALADEAHAEGYEEGVRDAVDYLAEVFEGVYDTDVFSRLGVSQDDGSPAGDIPGFEGVKEKLDAMLKALGEKGK